MFIHSVERGSPCSRARRGDGQAKASRTKFWCLLAIRINACAAPDGERRPCSHAWSVRLEMLRAAANSACDRPVPWRASTTSFGATSVARTKLRALISRTDCRNFSPSSPPALGRLACLVDAFFYLLSGHARLSSGKPGEADHPNTVPLATAGPGPSDLPAATAVLDDCARVGLARYPGEELQTLFGGPKPPGFSYESWRPAPFSNRTCARRCPPQAEPGHGAS